MLNPIQIDPDKECGRCHGKGATKSGLCLSCAAESMAGRTINHAVIQQAQAEVSAMLFEHAGRFDGSCDFPHGLSSYYKFTKIDENKYRYIVCSPYTG